MENSTITTNATAMDGENINLYSIFWEIRLSSALHMYVIPIIVIVGIVRNIMSFVVFSTKTMNGSVSSIFFQVLAIVDTLILFTVFSFWFTKVVFHSDFLNLNIVACKIGQFLVYWTTDLPGWTLSYITIERAIGVSMPHHHKRLVTRKRAYILLAIINVTLLSKYLWVLFRNKNYNEHDSNGQCYLLEIQQPIWHYMDFAVYCICPFIIIFTSNVCVIYFIVQASYRCRHSMTNHQSTNHSTNPTIILILVSVIYLCCTFPIMAYFIIESIWYNQDMSYKKLAQLSLFHSFASLLVTVNSAVTFVLYCLSGPRFRQALKNILFKRRIEVN